MATGIKVTINGEDIFDTDSPTLSACQIHQMYSPRDAADEYGYKSVTIKHGLGYVPMMWLFMYLHDYSTWYFTGEDIAWDEQNLYIDAMKYNTITYIVMVFPIEITKDFRASKKGTFRPFTNPNSKVGINVKRGEEVLFSTSQKKVPVSAVIKGTLTQRIVTYPPSTTEDIYTTWTMNHKLGSIPMFDCFGKIRPGWDEWGQGARFVGKWKMIGQSLGSTIAADSNNTYVESGSNYPGYYDDVSSVVYGVME